MFKKQALAILVSACILGFVSAQYDYNLALSKSLLFYEAQRSGALPSSNRIDWRGNTFLDDGTDVGVDLSGGYFDGKSPPHFFVSNEVTNVNLI